MRSNPYIDHAHISNQRQQAVADEIVVKDARDQAMSGLTEACWLRACHYRCLQARREPTVIQVAWCAIPITSQDKWPVNLRQETALFLPESVMLLASSRSMPDWGINAPAQKPTRNGATKLTEYHTPFVQNA